MPEGVPMRISGPLLTARLTSPAYLGIPSDQNPVFLQAFRSGRKATYLPLPRLSVELESKGAGPANCVKIRPSFLKPQILFVRVGHAIKLDRHERGWSNYGRVSYPPGSRRQAPCGSGNSRDLGSKLSHPICYRPLASAGIRRVSSSSVPP